MRYLKIPRLKKKLWQDIDFYFIYAFNIKYYIEALDDWKFLKTGKGWMTLYVFLSARFVNMTCWSSKRVPQHATERIKIHIETVVEPKLGSLVEP